MRFQTTATFDRDYKRLPPHHQQKFRRLIPQFNEAADRAAAGASAPWPNGMRVKPVRGAKGVWELTWSMDDPDGRATWEWANADGQPCVRWRRVGNHGIFDAP